MCDEVALEEVERSDGTCTSERGPAIGATVKAKGLQEGEAEGSISVTVGRRKKTHL